jgi:chromosomal replication initiator protein
VTSPATEHASAERLDPPARAAWEAVIEHARQELPESAFNLWFADLAPGELRGDVLEIIAPNAYVKNWLTAHHVALMTASAQEVLGPSVTVRLVVRRGKRGSGGAGSGQADQAGEGRSSQRPGRGQSTLNDAIGASPFPDRYTFDTFVAGASNKFAHAASLAVAEAPPSKAYNPVFMYGGWGVGSSHI